MKKIFFLIIALPTLFSYFTLPVSAVGIFGACTTDSECNEFTCAGNACFCGTDYRGSAPDSASIICRIKKTLRQSCAPGSTTQCVTALTCNISGLCVNAEEEAARDAAAEAASGASCPCSCQYSEGIISRLAEIPGGVMGVNTCTGPRSQADAAQACRGLCQTVADNARGTLTDSTVRCSASLFTNTPTCGATTPSTDTPARTDFSPASFGYINPLGTASVPELISRLIRAVLGIVGALFLAMFVYGGVLWTTAGGDPKKVQSSKTTLMNAVIGIVIIAFSYAIVSTILGFAGSITSSS